MQRRHPNRSRTTSCTNSTSSPSNLVSAADIIDTVCAGYNDQPTQRRRGAAGKKSITGTTKRNRDQDSRTNTSPLLTSTHAEQSLKVSDSPLESRNGIAIAHQMKNSLSYQLRRVFCGSAILKGQYNRHTYMTLIKMTEIFTAVTWTTTHHNAAVSGHRGHTPCQRSYTNTKTKTRDNALMNVIHKITTIRLDYTYSTNTTCTWKTEADGNTCTPILGISNFTQIGNPDSNSRKVTGQRITITSDQVSHISETTHPRPYTLDGAIEYWINRRRQLQRCQANHPLSYEAFLRANQPAEGHPADDTWDYGQLYRLHMIRAKAVQEIIKSFDITEDDVDNYLIRAALADNQLDNDAKSSSSTDQRRVPGGKRTTTDEEDIFFQRSLRTPRPTAGVTSNAYTVRTSTTKTSKFQRKHKNPKHIRNISAIVDTGAQVTTMPESAISKMPNAHNHRDAPPGTAVKYGNGELETIEHLVDIGHYEVQVTPDNCAATLISVDQIVEDEHTVTSFKTQTIITDEEGRYRLQYDRAQGSRE
jgi:hypothetical protein